MALMPTIDETGIHQPEYIEIENELKTRWREIFGEDLYLEPDSQEGEALEIFALANKDAGDALMSAYNSFSVTGAQGVGLSRMVKINGIRRRNATTSYVDVRIVGVAGTIINGGIVEDVANRKWNLPPVVTIPYEGEITVTATAQEYGEVRVQPGEINKIATPTRGWQTVENLTVSIVGAAIETDAELRLRQSYSVALPSLSVFEGIWGAVANVKDVVRVRGYENDTNIPDEHGIPGHHISFVVDGGDIEEIANAISIKKTPGTGTYGDIIIPTFDMYGVRKDIRFYRPTVVELAIDISLIIKQGYNEIITDQIIKNLLQYIDELGIGNSVLISKLYCPIDEADVSGIRSGNHNFDIENIMLSRDGGALSESNIEIAFNEMAVLYPENITITLTPI